MKTESSLTKSLVIKREVATKGINNQCLEALNVISLFLLVTILAADF